MVCSCTNSVLSSGLLHFDRAQLLQPGHPSYTEWEYINIVVASVLRNLN